VDSDTLQAEQERMRARNQRSESRPCHCFSHSGIEFERHFSVQEIAEMWAWEWIRYASYLSMNLASSASEIENDGAAADTLR